MVGSKTADLAETLDVLNEDPHTTVVDVQGSPRAPSLIVIEAKPRQVERLKEKLGGEVTVEPNPPLEPFG